MSGDWIRLAVVLVPGLSAAVVIQVRRCKAARRARVPVQAAEPDESPGPACAKPGIVTSVEPGAEIAVPPGEVAVVVNGPLVLPVGSEIEALAAGGLVIRCAPAFEDGVRQLMGQA